MAVRGFALEFFWAYHIEDSSSVGRSGADRRLTPSSSNLGVEDYPEVGRGWRWVTCLFLPLNISNSGEKLPPPTCYSLVKVLCPGKARLLDGCSLKSQRTSKDRKQVQLSLMGSRISSILTVNWKIFFGEGKAFVQISPKKEMNPVHLF